MRWFNKRSMLGHVATGRKSELYYEELGASFDEFMSAYDVERRVQLIDALLPKRRDFENGLEVGCGTGAVTQHFYRRVRNLTVSDLSAQLAESTGKAVSARWCREDACHLSFSDNTFDLVLSSECIEHTPDPVAAVKEMARVLAPGGTLVLTTPNRLWYPIVWGASRLHLRRFQGNEFFLWPGTVISKLRECGISGIRVQGCHLFPWQIPFAKRFLPYLDQLGRTLYPIMINFGVAGEKEY